MNAEWEVIEKRPDGSSTARMMVPSGWLVRIIEGPADDGDTYSVALAFVPDLECAWIIDGAANA